MKHFWHLTFLIGLAIMNDQCRYAKADLPLSEEVLERILSNGAKHLSSLPINGVGGSHPDEEEKKRYKKFMREILIES